MVRIRSLIVICSLLLSAAVAARAQEMEKPSDDKKDPKPTRLVLPWSKLTSLSEEQKQKINQIHQDALTAKRKIEDKEEADIRALLTDEQKMELKKLEDARKAEDKMRRPPAKAGEAEGMEEKKD